MTTEAIKLADDLDKWGGSVLCENAAAELRRLDTLNKELVASLTRIRALPVHPDAIRVAHNHAEAALAKAGEKQ